MIRTSDEVTAISAAIVKAQADMPGAPKTTKGQVGNQVRWYADMAAVVEAARPVLAKHELGYVQFPAYGQGTVTVTTRLLHSSGEWMESDLDMPAGTGGAQSVGSALTYAKRYALMAVLGMASEDDDGGAASKPPPAPRKQPAAPPSAPPLHGDPATEKQIQRIQIMMNGRGDRDAKLAFLSEMVGRQLASSKELTKAEAGSVLDYLDAS